MKNIILSPVIIFWFYSCNVKPEPDKQQTYSTSLSVVIDVTDPRIYWPDANNLLQIYHCKETPDAECLFRLKTISDVRLTPIVTYRLADVRSMKMENTEDDPQFRNKNINAFYTTVRNALADFYTKTDTSRSLDNSECFRSIVDELRFLTESKSNDRTLVVTGDLMEHSDLLNSYTASLSDTKAIADKLNKGYPVPENLKGITIIFLFNPKNREEDKTYSQMIEVYRSILEPTGAEIKVQANL